MGEANRLITGKANVPRCEHRGPHDDFFCLRYGVWYPSYDCAVRTRYRTCAGCEDCEQGRFNLKRHNGTVVRPRLLKVNGD